MTRNQWLIIGGLGMAVMGICMLVVCFFFVFFLATPTRPIAEAEVVTATPFVKDSSPPSGLPRPTFTVLPKSTEIPRAVVQSSDTVALRDHRCIGKEDDMTCVFTVQNTGGAVVGSTYFDINVFDPQGITLRSSFIAFNHLFPGETRKELTHIGAPAGSKFGKYTVGSARTSDLFKIAGLESNPFQVSNIEYKAGTYSNSVIAIISNTSNKSIDDARVTAILYDKSGAFIGGGDTFAPIILPNGKARVEITVRSSGTVSKVEVYPALANISTVK